MPLGALPSVMCVARDTHEGTLGHGGGNHLKRESAASSAAQPSPFSLLWQGEALAGTRHGHTTGQGGIGWE